jgi:hypothetical protein
MQHKFFDPEEVLSYCHWLLVRLRVLSTMDKSEKLI